MKFFSSALLAGSALVALAATPAAAVSVTYSFTNVNGNVAGVGPTQGRAMGGPEGLVGPWGGVYGASVQSGGTIGSPPPHAM